MFKWCNFPFQAWSEVRLAAGWIAEQRLSTLASNSPILCSRIPDMSSPQPVRTWTMCASESGQLQSEICVFMMNIVLFSVLFPKTWSEFVTCIKQYTSDCLTADQVRTFFNRNVRNYNGFIFCYRDQILTEQSVTASTVFIKCAPTMRINKVNVT